MYGLLTLEKTEEWHHMYGLQTLKNSMEQSRRDNKETLTILVTKHRTKTNKNKPQKTDKVTQ